MAGLQEKGVEVSHCRIFELNIVEDNIRVIALLPMWVITITKKPENVMQITGILNFVIRIQDFNLFNAKGNTCKLPNKVKGNHKYTNSPTHGRDEINAGSQLRSTA